MNEKIDLIFKELDNLEESATRLRATCHATGRQTNLEVAILSQQVAELQNKNQRAAEYIDQAEKILTKLKKA